MRSTSSSVDLETFGNSDWDSVPAVSALHALVSAHLHDQTLSCNLLLILFACNLEDGLVTEFQLVQVQFLFVLKLLKCVQAG